MHFQAERNKEHTNARHRNDDRDTIGYATMNRTIQQNYVFNAKLSRHIEVPYFDRMNSMKSIKHSLTGWSYVRL